LLSQCNPSIEANFENGDGDLARETRGGFKDASFAQCLRDRRRKRRELDELALAQLSARGNDCVALTREVAAILK
jgi:hypothetical protein